MSDTDYLKKTPPSDPVSEKAILGLIMLDENRAKEILPLCNPEHFYSPKNRRILETMIVLASTDATIDLVTVTSKLDGVIPASYVSSLMDGLPRRAKADSYLASLAEKSQCRQIMEHCQRILEVAAKGDHEGMTAALSKINIRDIQASKEVTAVQQVLDYIDVTDGDFSVTQLSHALQSVTRPNIRQILHRLRRDGVIDKSGRKDGVYRKIEAMSESLDWRNASTEEFPISLPLGLNDIIQILPRSLICFAGVFDAGKTSLLLNIVKLNMGNMKVHYFTSELGENKMRARLELFKDIPFPDGWTFDAWYRVGNFGDAIKQYPNDLSIIDYIEETEDPYLTAAHERKIFNQLDTGVAVVAIQKKIGSDFGWGGQSTLHIPSLYIAVDHNWMKIIKAKEFRGEHSPRNKVLQFKLYHGAEFNIEHNWQYQDDLNDQKIDHPWSPKSQKTGTRYLK